MQSKRICAILGACCIACFSQAAPASQQTPEDLAQLWIIGDQSEFNRGNSSADSSGMSAKFGYA
jgi:hypothetical protein